mgnify:CR=1 FL=1
MSQMNTATPALRDLDIPSLYQAFCDVRAESESICKPLEIEDYGIQTMPDVSPPKWHLAHTSWFFETFILKPFVKNYSVFHPKYEHLFNSYYEQVGSFHPRPERGLLSRPTVAEIYEYRQYVDKQMGELLVSLTNQIPDKKDQAEILKRTGIGLNHEQQHQELMLTDIKHIFANNPLKPVYLDLKPTPQTNASPLEWFKHPAGIYKIGYSGEDYSFDNEGPAHKVYLEPFAIASRLTTNAEFLEFIKVGGYDNPAYWLSDGWKKVQTEQWQQPFYWSKEKNIWYEMTLTGMRPLDLQAPVSHVSLYEANAYANWLDKRLPTEQEWEVAASQYEITGNFREQGFLQPIVSTQNETSQFFGDVWEWTQSSYSPYPGYKAAAGALGEYNGKFMSSQFVLRGGSCVTPLNHIRASYRNFFYPADRWQFSGIRIAETL